MAGRLIRGGSTARRAVVVAVLLGVLAVVGVAVALADSGPPAPVLTAKPANPTNSQVAAFSYTDSQSVSFRCSLDGSAFVACGGPGTSGSKTYPGSQSAGSHTFQVKAVSGSNSTTTSYSWVIDLTAPTVTSINTASANPTNAASVSWTVTFSKTVTGVAASNFALVMGGSVAGAGPPVVSGSGSTYTVSANTGSGSGTLQLKLQSGSGIKDLAGNGLGPPISFNGQTYTIDKTAPTVSSITRADPSPTNAGSVHWNVIFSKPVTGVGNGNFSLVASGLSGSPAISGVSGSGSSYTVTASTGTGTPSGSGTLQLRLSNAGSIKDGVGNGLSGVPFNGETYAIDKTPPPVPSITSKPANPTNQTGAHFVFSDTEGTATLLCQLDGGGFSVCTSPKDYPGPLSQGSHSFQVEARDVAGNTSSPASWTWTVDTTPPNAPTIQSAPFAWPPVGWASTNAIFTFNDSSPDVASFLCKLDAGAFVFCISPQSYSGLAQGQHTFKVKAVDQAGNVSGETSWTFFVDTIPPNQPTLTGFPPAFTSSQNATFSWTDNGDPGYPATGSGIATHACKLDNGNWQPCSSPTTYNNLSFSSHTFQVVAIDWAGNISTAASSTWTVSNTTTGMPFTIAGNATGLLYPGAAATPIALTISNPNNVPIYVTSVTVTVTNNPNGCTNLTNVVVQQSSASSGTPITVPANAANFAVPASFQPKVQLKETGVNQNVCKGQTFSLSYSGSAHS